MFSLIFLLATATSADPQFTKLKEGEPAPWDGRLFNDEAVAKLVVENKFKIEECNIQTNYELNKLRAELDLEHSKNLIELEAQVKILEAKVDLRDDRIKNLEKLKPAQRGEVQKAMKKDKKGFNKFFKILNR